MTKRTEEMPVINRLYNADLYERDWFGVVGSSIVESLVEVSSKKEGRAVFANFLLILRAAGEKGTPEQAGIIVDALGNVSLITLKQPKQETGESK